MKEHYNMTVEAVKWKSKENNDNVVYSEALRNKCFTTMERIDKIPEYKWRFYRKICNAYDFNCREFAVNRAFYKLWEILSIHFPLLMEETMKEETKTATGTLHLAEAPGSFVQAVKMFYKNSHFMSIAVSKPASSYADVLKKGKKIPQFHPKVLSLSNCEFAYKELLDTAVLKSFITSLNKGSCLITADGGFDEELRYDSKESLHYNLIISEIICILLTQQFNGSCILKVFETFTETSICILYLLCLHYESFDIVKPQTSRPTNAERYVVCKRFKGCKFSQSDLYRLLEHDVTEGNILTLKIPKEFRDKIIDVNEKITKVQIDSIEHVLGLIQTDFNSIEKKQMLKDKKDAFSKWKMETKFQSFK